MVAAVQMDVRLGEKTANLEAIRERSAEAARLGARLVVFPECVLTGYCFESFEEARALAEPAAGPSAAAIAELCREHSVHIVYGYIEEDGGRIYNALRLVGPEGALGGYRKVHIPHLGLDFFVTPGDRPFDVVETPICRIGMNICYDGAFPESSRLLALAGAELIVLPTNWPTGAEEFARYALNTRALENKVYYAAANRVGSERGFRFIGTSRIVDVHGRTLAEADDRSESIITAAIRPALARDKKIIRVPGKHWIDRFADRRPELYGPLGAPGDAIDGA